MSKLSLTALYIAGAENVDGLLPGSIRHIGQIADEVIVVASADDGTGQLAAEAGATVVCRPWPHDYARQRNYALSLVRTDAVLILDADEFIDDAFGDRWPDVMHRRVGALSFPTLHYVRPTGGPLGLHLADNWYPDLHPRCFRMSPALHYEGGIHEQPMDYGEGIILPSIHLHHFGWARAEEFLTRKVTSRNGEELAGGYSAGVHELWSGPWSDCQPEWLPRPSGFEESMLVRGEANERAALAAEAGEPVWSSSPVAV